jgi:hypothetical protein
MQKQKLVVLLPVLMLGACSKQFVLVADNAQIGAGSTIIVTGTTGVLHAPPGPGLPNGFDGTLTLKDSVQDLSGAGVLSFRSEGGGFGKGAEITFIKAAGLYACKDCTTWNLPLTWHRGS